MQAPEPLPQPAEVVIDEGHKVDRLVTAIALLATLALIAFAPFN
jgi:hypothetical protein